MVRNLTGISHVPENEVLENLKKDLENYPEFVKKEKSFGRICPPTSAHLKKNVYIYFSELAKKRDLSDEALEWMGEFVKTYEEGDIKDTLHKNEWVQQYRDMKRIR